jgi:hypothetical protein
MSNRNFVKLNNLRSKRKLPVSPFIFRFSLFITICSLFITSCGIYTFKDSSIDYKKFKTIKIGVLENRARYVNPQLTPQLNDKLQQKITSQTKLTRTNSDNAD